MTDVLFAAEVDVEKAAGYILLTTLAGLLGGGVKWLWDRLDARKAQGRADEETAVTRLEKLVARLDNDRASLSDRVDNLTEQLTEARVKAERAVTWIKHLEAVLDNLPTPPKFRRWTDDPTGDTSTHSPVPTAGGQTR